MKTWEEQRLHIQSNIDELFGKSIEIRPRAMAALQIEDVDDEYTDQIASGFEITVLQSLLRSSPACSTILFKAGVQIDTIRFPSTRPTPAVLADCTLDWIFKGVDSSTLVPTAQGVRSSGILDETDILISALEASLQGTESNGFGWELLKASRLALPGKQRRTSQDELWNLCDAHLRTLVRQVRALADADPSHALVQFVIYEDERHRIRIRPFGTTGLAILDEDRPVKEGHQYVYRGGVLQPVESVFRELPAAALEEFEELLNSAATTERDYQTLFEQYPFFLAGLDFGRAHPQPVLYEDDGGSLVPDFFLEKLGSGWDAIVDLKRPYDDMVRRRPNRVYFRESMQNAIGQLRYYREWFDDSRHRQEFEHAYGIRTFRPKMVVVMGRRHHFLDDVERVRLMDSLPERLELWTYDDLRDRARKYLGSISHR